MRRRSQSQLAGVAATSPSSPAGEFAALPIGQRQALQHGARETAKDYCMARTADAAIKVYEALLKRPRAPKREPHDAWQRTLRLLRSEWDLLAGIADAAVAPREDERQVE